MGRVAVQAVLPDGGVFPQEGTPLFRMAGVAQVIDIACHDHFVPSGPMRVMAVRAGDLPLADRVVGTLPGGGANVLVAAVAGFTRCYLLELRSI